MIRQTLWMFQSALMMNVAASWLLIELNLPSTAVKIGMVWQQRKSEAQAAKSRSGASVTLVFHRRAAGSHLRTWMMAPKFHASHCVLAR
jgi:hypothetical protein